MYKVLFFITSFVIVLVVVPIVRAKSGIVCDESLFYSPYAKVKRQRNGGDVETLNKTGFLDMYLHINVILCVNGPAVLLEDYKEVQSRTDVVSIFSNGTMKVYSHECMRVNKVSPQEEKRMRDEGITRISDKAGGVQLVGESSDYTKETAAWFLQQSYGHAIHPHKIVTDGSFAIIGNAQQFCLRVNHFSVVLTSKAKTPLEICTWTPQAIDVRYEHIFRWNRTISEYSWDLLECPTGQPLPTPSTTTTEPPLPPDTVTFDPFSVLDPNGHNPNPHPHPTHSPGPIPSGTPDILLEYKVDLKTCHIFPTFDKTGCDTSSVDHSCELFDQILDNDPKVLEPDLQWKNEILDLIAEIFGLVCEPFDITMPYVIHKVLEFYLVLAHEADKTNTPPKFPREKRHHWDFILTDLKICRKNIQDEMWFDWKYKNFTYDDPVIIARRKRSVRHATKLNYDDYDFYDSREDYSEEDNFQENYSREENIYIKYGSPFHSSRSDFDFLDEIPSDINRVKKSSTTNTTSISNTTTNTSLTATAKQANLLQKWEGKHT